MPLRFSPGRGAASIALSTAIRGPAGADGGGGGGTPGGSTTQVQYNNAGSFGGITGATTNGTALTLVAPVLGTPASATLTNATGLPISTGVSGLGAGVATFLATPSSANLAGAVTDETGTGALVFANSPTLVTPALGTPSAAVLTNATGLPISTGVSGLAANIATFLGTPSSANLASAVTDETGSGALVFGTSPTFTTSAANLGYFDISEIAAPSNPAANVARFYSKDDGGTTKLYFRDSAGTETNLGAGGGGSPGGSSLQIQYNSGGSFAGANVWRTGANQLDLSNSTNAQALYVYKTTDTDGGSPTNYERIAIDWTTESGKVTIASQKGGTGSTRPIKIQGTAIEIISTGTTSGTLEFDAFGLWVGSTGSRIAGIPNSGIVGFEVPSNGGFIFSSSTNAEASADTGLCRPAAALVEVNNNSAGGVAYLRLNAVAVASLPAASSTYAGARGTVNNANATTFASIVAGGGSNVVPVYCDGTNWRIG